MGKTGRGRFSINDISIKYKIILIIMIISSITLIIACTAFLIYDSTQFKKKLVADLSVKSDVIANTTNGALTFNVVLSATEELNALQSDKSILGAVIYKFDKFIGDTIQFATYVKKGYEMSFVPPEKLEAEGHEFINNHLNLFRNIHDQDNPEEIIGRLFICSDLAEYNERLIRYISIIGIILLGSSLIAFYLSSRLQLLISKPLLFLTKKAKEISVNQDYSIRIRKYTNDEVGGLIESFNEMLSEIEKQNATVDEQLRIITQANTQITDSINYAKRIQDAILPSVDKLERVAPDSFILFKPKDIVSGDFYWFTEKENELYIAAVDCTGHGVPGAFMSLIGSNVINRTVDQAIGSISVDMILNKLNSGIKKALKQNKKNSETQDGMDIALCKINTSSGRIEFAGANRPLVFFKDGKLDEIKGDKYPIGGNQYDPDILFAKNEIVLKKGDAVFLFSDGYPDQFGGDNDKKFTNKRFKEVLEENIDKPMKEIATCLDHSYKDWKGKTEQTDDILVIGVRI